MAQNRGRVSFLGDVEPMLAVWAETGLILADEFRDGNVPANELLEWLRNPEREDGPKGFIGFAISARMSEALRDAIEALPEDQWQIVKDEGDAIRSCAEVAFVPYERGEKKDSKPLRYIAIRIQLKQGHIYRARNMRPNSGGRNKRAVWRIGDSQNSESLYKSESCPPKACLRDP